VENATAVRSLSRLPATFRASSFATALSVGEATGSNGIAVVVVDKDSFRWIRGEDHVATWKKPDADWQMWFCRTCGSPLPGKNDETRMFVPAGLLWDSGESLEVTHHIWVDSRAGWDKIGDSGKQHRKAFEG
jgi:hypothetical protein